MIEERDDVPGPDQDAAEDQTVEAGGEETAPAGASQTDETPDAPIDAAGPDAELVELRDRLMRAVADTENTRKRAEKEVADMRVFALTAFSRDLLSVADNLARALDHVTPAMQEAMGETARTLFAGVELTQRELHAAFSRHGVAPIEVSHGDKLDPNQHQAATTLPSTEPANTIVHVIQSGWMIGDRVLRPAMVAVSSGVAPPAVQEPPANDSAASEGAATPGGTFDTKV